MAKLAPLNVRLSEEIKTALKKAAKDELRSLSSMAEKAIHEWLKQRRYLK